MSFDGSELAGWLRPRVVSVALPFVGMGRRAVDLVLDPPEDSAARVLVPMPVLAGGSVPARHAEAAPSAG